MRKIGKHAQELLDYKWVKPVYAKTLISELYDH